MYKLILKQFVKRQIKRDIYVPFYQGVYNLEDRKLKGIEVLARKKSKGRYISPYYFLPIIENMVLMNEFTQSIFLQTLAQIHTIDTSNKLDVSINVPPPLIEEQNFINFLRKNVIGGYNQSKFNLIIELTESAPITNKSSFIKMIKELQNDGLTFRIDDFGKDYCDFNTYFSELKIKEIKIDKSIVNGSQNTLQAVINFSDTLSVDLIAEGVETREKSKELLMLGIKYHQGFLYSKPSVIEKVALSI